MTHLAVAAALLACGATPPETSPDPKSLAVPPAEAARARALVRRLGSLDFPDRDEATKELRAMGRLALPALTAAAADPDPEVRLRCEILLPHAAAEDFAARLAAFLADADGKYEHDLPGWAKFRELTGNDRLARPLFAELLKSEPNRDLIAGLTLGKTELTRRLTDRELDLFRRMYPRGPGSPTRYEPTLLDAAGLLFAEAVAGDVGAPAPRGRFRQVTPYILLGPGGLYSALDTDQFGPAIAKLAVAWMDTRETAAGLSQAVSLAAQLGRKDGVKYAARLIKAPGATAYQRASAAATVARLGGKADLAVLKPLLTDETAVRTPVANGLTEIQVRDVALAMAAHLAGRDPAEFGLQPQSEGESAKFSYWNYSFPDEESRKAGFARWAELEPKLAPKK